MILCLWDIWKGGKRETGFHLIYFGRTNCVLRVLLKGMPLITQSIEHLWCLRKLFFDVVLFNLTGGSNDVHLCFVLFLIPMCDFKINRKKILKIKRLKLLVMYV